MRIGMGLILACSMLTGYGQTVVERDTLTLMHYNLLYYGATSGQCSTTNNNVNDKDGYLKKIVGHAKPDIFTVNEMGCNSVYGQRILERCLNVDGETKWASTTLQTNGSQNLCNMLFYNTEKVGHLWIDRMEDDGQGNRFVRSIDLHELYYQGEYLNHRKDTLKFKVIVAHLKAGNTSGDRNERDWTTDAVMTYLSSAYRDGNMIFSGDLNVYRSTEEGYQNLTNFALPDYSFQDPINRPGSWNNNGSFADVHTQSTHSNFSNPCFSSGGMDDRFDQSLVSKLVMNGTAGMQYLTGSYEALGQDGQRFNQSINSPANTAVPADIADALYDMSDHLPVILDVEVSRSYVLSDDENTTQTPERSFWVSAAPNNALKITVNAPAGEMWTAVLTDLSGRTLYSSDFNTSSKENLLFLTAPVEQAGIYLISMYTGRQRMGTKKVFLTP